MANQHAKKTRPTRARTTGTSRSRGGHPGHPSGARENGAHRNPNADPERARAGRSRPRGGQATAKAAAPRSATPAATPKRVMDRARNTLGEAGARAANGVRSAGARAAQGLRAAGSKASDSINEHPTAVNAIGAGLAVAGIALIATRLLRQSSAGKDEGGAGDSLFERAGEALGSIKGRVGGAVDSLREGTSRLGEYGREGLSKVGTGLREGASAVGSGAEQGYEYTRDMLGNLWDEHPLAIGAGLLALGAVAGMMIPTTRLERSFFGESAGRLTRRAQSAGRELLEQGRRVAENVVNNAGEAVHELADLDALAPDRLTRKVKRFTNRLKEAVTDAMQD